MFNRLFGENRTYYIQILLHLICIVPHISAADERPAITIIGVGRLGICMALCCENAGYNVLGVDLNQAYVESLNNKTFHSLEPGVNELLLESKDFTASCDLDKGLHFGNIYYIMVDTPSTPEKEAYDHKNVDRVLSEINRRKVSHKHIVIGCTVFPGYTQSVGKPLLKDCVNTTLSYNPSFIAQGNILEGLWSPDMILIGEGSRAAGAIIEKLHRTICVNDSNDDVTICRMSPESAEIAKLAVNCFITTKIAFANMIGDIADSTPGAEKEAILAAIGSDERIGLRCLKAGYGFGGPCFPRDNRALGNYAEMVGVDSFIPRATDDANKHHATYMASQFLEQNKEVYTFENVAYKEHCKVSMIDESQKLVVAKLIANAGKRVRISDTELVINEVKKQFGKLFEYQAVDKNQ